MPDAAARKQAAELLAHSIREAHAAGPDSWVTSLFPAYIRLNVGPAEMVTITANGVRCLLDRRSDWKAIRPLCSEVGESREYASLPESRLAIVGQENLLRGANTLKSAISVSAATAVAARRQTTWAESQADGVLLYLEETTGSSLPRPESTAPRIDAYLFQQHFKAFCTFVSGMSGRPFTSFREDDYVDGQEGYKSGVFHDGNRALQVKKWRRSHIGSGRIIDRTIAAIEVPRNNLLRTDSRFGAMKRGHQPLYEARDETAQRAQVEQALYDLYLGSDDEAAFRELTAALGSRYSLIAYLFFLKDRSRFLPIAPEAFDRALGYLGVEFQTAYKCSWSNYVGYLRLVESVRVLLDETLNTEVTLLDAHSFLWILTSQMRYAKALPNVRQYLQLSDTEREAISKARIGQGRFRDQLLTYWGGRCAVGECRVSDILGASHIKPWSEAEPRERIECYNGLLLSPALDRCFDRGFVSFADDGRILISSQLSEADLESIGIDRRMKLRRIEAAHRPFLAYHRAKHGFDQKKDRRTSK